MSEHTGLDPFNHYSSVSVLRITPIIFCYNSHLMKTEAIYPYEGGGIQMDEIFAQGENDWVSGQRIIGGSGSDLFYTIGPRKVVITDALADFNYWMIAEVNFSGVFKFDVTTRRDGIPHPDFFAKAFVGAALGHFQTRLERSGQTITECEARWEPRGVNFEKFLEAYRATRSKRKAALSTWTGQVYARYGFGRIRDADVLLMRSNNGYPRGGIYLV